MNRQINRCVGLLSNYYQGKIKGVSFEPSTDKGAYQHHDGTTYINKMDLETTVYVSVGVLAAVCLALGVLLALLYLQLLSLKRTIQEVQTTSRLRVQKLKLDPESDKNHAFHNPTISPDEELSKRGYSMYMGGDVDVESGRGTERQTGRQLLDDLNREIDQRHNRHSTAPPFLLQGIEENKRRSRSLINTTSSTERASETNPNFIY